MSQKTNKETIRQDSGYEAAVDIYCPTLRHRHSPETNWIAMFPGHLEDTTLVRRAVILVTISLWVFAIINKQ